MMASEYLEVWLDRERVGFLESRKGTLVFRYDSVYRGNPTATPLSLSLPLNGPDAYVGERAHLFFAGLLPEGRMLDHIARQYGVSASNVYGLLEAIGGDCAGAISLFEPGSSGEAVPDRHWEPVTPDELAFLLADLPRYPMRDNHGGMRFSLAGAQNKLAIAINDDGYALPQNGAASTHILKPSMGVEPRFAWSTVANEAFCLEIARRIGLPAPASRVLDLQGPVLAVERYDRVTEYDEAAVDGRIRRLHQEDFCQALAISPAQKYQNEGGPGLADCMALIRDHADAPVQGGLALLRWTFFNYLVGNADAHARNLSLLLQSESVRLAPFYDLLSTAVYPEHTAKMAMKIGGHYDSARVCAERHWRRCADELGVGWPLVRRTGREMVTKVQDAAEQAQIAIEDQLGESVPLLDTLRDDVIAKRCARTRKALGG